MYASNNQLGGVQIMYNNGVSHKTEVRDLDGVYTVLKWLSYMPKVNSEFEVNVFCAENAGRSKFIRNFSKFFHSSRIWVIFCTSSPYIPV